MGMALGLVPIETVNRLARKWIPVLCVYALYHLGSYHWGEIYAVQIFGAVASVLLLYTCALHLSMSSWTGRQMVLLGRYSLLAYLAQIGLLQAMVRFAGGRPEHWAGVIAAGGLTAALVFLLVNLINSLRPQIPIRGLDLQGRIRVKL